MKCWQDLIGALPFEWAHYGFMQQALLAALLIAPLFAFLGCIVVNRQMAFFSEAIGHSTLTGIALGTLAGLADPTGPMAAFAVALALLLTWLRRRSAASADTLIGLVMAITVALGVVLLSRGGGFAKYSRFLIGDLLTISPAEILRLALLTAACLLVLTPLFNRLFLAGVSTELARSRRMPVAALEALFAALVALVVAVCVPWVGLLVINSLLILPAAAARNMARGTPAYFQIAAVISLCSCVAGLICSFFWASATGATIVLFAAAFYAVSLVFRRS